MGAGTWLASALAGVVSRSVVHPLDTIRTVQMVSGGSVSLAGALRSVVAADGMRGLYRGFAASLALQAPAVSVYLSVYEWSRDNLRCRFPHTAPFLSHTAAGFAAEAASALIWAPMEVVKQRAQCRPRGARSGSIAVLRDLLRVEGPAALFSGYFITLGVFGPYAMLYFVVYERCRAEVRKRDIQEGGVSISVSAACAGAVAAFATTPLDVVKTRLQTQGDVADSRQGRAKYAGSWDAVRRIAGTEGYGAFFKGVFARMLWIMPGTAITMSTFEFLKLYVGDKPAIGEKRQAIEGASTEPNV